MYATTETTLGLPAAEMPAARMPLCRKACGFFLAAFLTGFLLGLAPARSWAGPPVSAPLRPGTGSEDKRLWRNVESCGINSAYVLLALSGRPVRYSEIAARLPVARDGVSLGDMKACLASFGLPAVVQRATPESLRQVPLPAIAHCEEEKAATGHYVVITAVTADHVEMIDGTNGNMVFFPMSDFQKNWSGYLLVTEKPEPSRLFFRVAVVAGLVSLGACAWIAYRQRAQGGAAPCNAAQELASGQDGKLHGPTG